MRPADPSGSLATRQQPSASLTAPVISDPVMRLEKRRRILAELKKQLDKPAWLSVSSEAQHHALRDLVERLERVVADGDAAVSRQRMPQADS